MDVRHKCMGLKRVVFWRVLHHIADGRKGRKRHAERAAEPARIEELPAKIKIILQTIYHAISRHLRARFAYPDLLPPSKNPAVWLGSCLVGGGGFEPPKSSTTDLQSAPFGHSGILPNFTPQSVLASLWYFAGTPSFCPHEEGSRRGLWSW